MSEVTANTTETNAAAGDAAAPLVAAPKKPPTAEPEIRLKRFLYLTDEKLRFISGDPEQHGHFKKETVECIEQLLAKPDGHKLFFNIIENVNGENILSHRQTLFFALAIAGTLSDLSAEVKHQVYRTVLQVCRADVDLFSFIKLFSKQKKNLPTGVNKMIWQFYLNKDPMHLARDIYESNSYFGWKHKDLIKLSHIKSVTKTTAVLVSYILFGLEKAIATAEETDETKELLQYLQDTTEIRLTKDESKVLELLPKIENVTNYQFHQSLTKSQAIWTVLIDKISMQKLVSSLLTFYKWDFFKNDNPMLNQVIERLTNADQVKQSKIHPYEVFIAARNFEKGGKPRDPRFVQHLNDIESASARARAASPTYVKPDFARVEVPKCPRLVSALHRCVAHAHSNVEGLGKRYLLTIEVSPEMDQSCLSNKNVTCLEAAVLMAFATYRAERNVTVAVFNGAGITPIQFEKGTNFQAILTKVKEAAHDYVAYGQPIEWAIQKKKQIDVFMVMAHNLIPRRLPKGVLCNPVPALERYHKKKGSQPNTKLILHSLGCASGGYFDQNSCVLNVHGFDENVPKVVNAFITDKF